MLFGKLIRDVVVVAGGVILGEEIAKSPKVQKFARELRDEVRRGLHETAKGVASFAKDCADRFAEKPKTQETPQA